VIWLGDGIEDDDTHGHIDDLCRFINEDTIVTIIETNTEDNNYLPLQDNLKRLQSAKLENGSLQSSWPNAQRVDFEDLRLPASYANFLILNKCVLVPQRSQRSKSPKHSCRMFPRQEIIGISAIDLIWGFGTLHCLNQQIQNK
jgi:agmatine deiminase